MKALGVARLLLVKKARKRVKKGVKSKPRRD
jgi:hypothetical protein